MIECSKNLDVKDHAKVETLMIMELMVAHSYGEKEILLEKNEEKKNKEKELERALEMWYVTNLEDREYIDSTAMEEDDINSKLEER